MFLMCLQFTLLCLPRTWSLDWWFCTLLQERWCQTELASSTLGCRTFNSSMRQQAAAGKLTMPLGKVGSTKQWQCIWVRLDSVILLESNFYLFDIDLFRCITPSNNLISAYKCIKSRFLSGIGCCPFLCVSRLSVSGTGRVRAWAGPEFMWVLLRVWWWPVKASAAF